MTVRQWAAALPRLVPTESSTGTVNAEERRQREHELAEALIAARHLQALLEMLGDRNADVRVVQSLRHSLARDLAALADLVPHG